MNQSEVVHPVDEKLPLRKLFILGLQHVLVMYAGAISIPLILGGALNLPAEQVAMLINADLFVCGIATLIQSIGIWKFGIRLPVMMGVSFAAVGPMLAMGANPGLGLVGIYGAVIGAGIVTIMIAPFICRLLPLFPPVVTGTIITIIGISLIGVGLNWAAGGQPMINTIVDGVGQLRPNPVYGAPENLAVAAVVLIAILLITKYVRGFLGNVAVLMGIIIGYIIAVFMGKVNFSGLDEAPWLGLVHPFQFGLPVFNVWAIITMSLVMIVIMIESIGMFWALGEITEHPVTQIDLTRGLRMDGLATLIGGIFNAFPYSSYSQNVGLVQITGVRSRWVCAAAGAILLLFGLFPKMAHVAASVPQFVLGGAGIVMFGMVAATGIKILSKVDFEKNRYNLFIVAISIGMGMIPLGASKFFDQMPKALAPLLHSGILLTSLAAVLLNAYFNGQEKHEQAQRNAIATAKSSEAH